MPVAGNGAEALAALVARIKVEASDTNLRRELLRGLKKGAAPLVPLVKASALEKLPRGGGLNKTVSDRRVTVSVRTSLKTAGVRLKTTNQAGNRATDEGHVRHPVFAMRTTDRQGKTRYIGKVNGSYVDPAKQKVKWVDEKIPNAAGWWSDTLKVSGPLVTPELIGVIDAVSVKLQRGL